MTKSVNVHEAKTHLSRLLDEAAAGEDIVIAKAGQPVAHLLALSRTPRPRGLFVHSWPKLDADGAFFEPLPDDELAAWQG